MALIIPLRDKTPQIGENCFLAENATIVGDVTMGNNCSVWFSAVIRGDVHYIKMGNNVNVQDCAVIHATYQKSPTNIGRSEEHTSDLPSLRAISRMPSSA